jgi:hypothetical protein
MPALGTINAAAMPALGAINAAARCDTKKCRSLQSMPPFGDAAARRDPGDAAARRESMQALGAIQMQALGAMRRCRRSVRLLPPLGGMRSNDVHCL